MSDAPKLSISKERKLNRKLSKLQHVLKKEANVITSDFPTKHVAISNAGLVNGLSEEVVFEHFSKFGTLTDIVLLPGKSCCFLSFENLESSIAAYNSHNGKLNIAQDNKPVYLIYVKEIPKSNDTKIWGHLPPGLILHEEFVTQSEEDILLNLYTFEKGVSGHMKHRLVKHFGFEFRYDINNVDKHKPLQEPIPQECDFLWPRLYQLNPEFKDFIPDQLTINHYLPGQGIPHHVDTHSAFEDPIVCLSLGSPTIMEFKNKDKHLCVLLPQRSLLIMSGESRYDWTHGIVPRKFDVVRNPSGIGYTCFKRNTRVSFTFRKVLQGECSCPFKSNCDSFTRSSSIKNNVAAKLEALHVHKVYENISDHFSETRHKPWPNVLEFVQSFELGALLVDIGCGNGKYLGNAKHIYDIGCDRSSGLIDICKGRGCEAFIGDCMSIPIKNGVADGAISIAVIHHLANEERRLQAIKEIVRILKIGGKALIYVWAHNQFKNQEKSSYIKQDRKNRKSDNADSITNPLNEQVSVLDGSVSLPIHTNRTQFQAKDVLVPWKLKNENKTTFLRFYHVFEENELDLLCLQLGNVKIIKSYYDQGNWCVILEKINV